MDTNEDDPVRVTGRRNELLAGLIAVSPLLIGVGAYGLLLGSLALQAGLDPLQVGIMSGTVFAGSAQFVAIDLWDTPLPVVTIVSAVFFVNLRHVLMGATITPRLLPWPAWQRYAALFLLADESWALAERRSLRAPLTPAYYFGLTAPLALVWIASTIVGASFGDLVADPSTYGLDFAFTAVFLTLLAGFWRRENVGPWAASALVALVASIGLPGVSYIVLGALAGTTLAFLQRNRDSDGE